MFTIETHAELPVPPSAVTDAIADLASWSTFRGYGPIPAILSASLEEGDAIGQGARVRVRNADGSTHVERVVSWEPGRYAELVFEVAPPVSYVFASMRERVWVEPGGPGALLRRRFDLEPASLFTWPVAWAMARVFLRRAIERHNLSFAGRG